MFEIDSAQIRGLLIERRLTVAAFAHRAGLTVVTVRRFLRNERTRATAPTVGKIAEALGVPPTQILKDDQF